MAVYSALTVGQLIIAVMHYRRGWAYYLAARVLCLFWLRIMLSFYRKCYASPTFPWWITFTAIFFLIILSASAQLFEDFSITTVVFEVMYATILINHLTALPFGFILIPSILTVAFWSLSVFHSDLLQETQMATTFYIAVFVILNIHSSYVIEKQGRENFNLQAKFDDVIQKTEKLLTQMIPEHVLKNLQKGITKTDNHEDVTILYADISGFTLWASDKQPIQVVKMLSKLFTCFDKLCVKRRVYKVHTIGDCYVVIGFTDADRRDPSQECLNVVDTGMEMLQLIRSMNRKKGTEFNMRIGIHTGTIIAGITGTSIVRYDIYGPDNDIANQMESEGVPGKVNISANTMSLLLKSNMGHFTYQNNKPILYAPTSTMIDSYFLYS